MQRMLQGDCDFLRSSRYVTGRVEGEGLFFVFLLAAGVRNVKIYFLLLRAEGISSACSCVGNLLTGLSFCWLSRATEPG